MMTKRELLRQSQLYCVLDAQVCEYEKLLEIIHVSAEAGIDIFQIRDKAGSAREILEFSKSAAQRLKGKQLFIVNDRVDIALSSHADGVHIGQEDMPLSYVRRLTGDDFIIGVSCQTLSQAIEAQEQGADYIGFGSVFKTMTKPERNPMSLDLLRTVINRVTIPVFPIGGIALSNVDLIRGCGSRRAAVTREICLAEDAELVVKKIKQKLNAV